MGCALRLVAMDTNQERLKEILAGAAALPAGPQRTEYLQRACGDDQVLRAKVEALVAAYDSVGNVLAEPMISPDPDSGMRTGCVIGRYKLLEEIGEGGFGRVFMAEQVQPVQRKVALKILKAGMDTKEVIARFEAERQALALMDHPNVARVLDAGTTETGRPYFVMELVRGIPLTEYCDRKSLPTHERLQLFMKVCQAVQHAHQNGIIHRDLKPSNILVTEIDGAAVPKIIDFGVAKALGQKLTQRTLFTAFHQMIGTPAYMSPEQAELSGVDVDTRSDIYSLGVLLYELLTGVTPFDPETLQKAALDEVRRVIRETEPAKPSTRLRTLGDKLSDVAKSRQAEPSALARSVHGDLDWIVMKCLEKDRRRRYETADGLVADLQHHLKHEPVLAGPPGAAYRAGKFIRRHHRSLVTTGAVVLLLVAAVVVTRQIAHWGPSGPSLAVPRLPGTSDEPLIKGIASVQNPAALSPDERMLAYVDWNAGGDLLVRDLASGAVRNLTRSEQHAPGISGCCPDVFVWSPDSKWIAYLWVGGPEAEESLCVVRAYGEQIRVLKTEASGLRLHPQDWTADGKQLLCTLKRDGKPTALAMVAADTGDVREVMADTRPGVDDPRLSPDGRFLVYAQREVGRSNATPHNLYMLELKTGQTTQMTFWPGDESGPIWAPRAPVVLFSSDRLGSWDLWGIRVQDGRPDPSPFLVLNGVGNYSKRFTQSGTLLVHCRVEGNAGYTIAGGVPGGAPAAAPRVALPGVIYFQLYGRIHSMRPDGSQKTRLPENVQGEPSQALHAGHRWFLQTREVPGAEYASGAKRRELFAVRDDGDEKVTVQLTEHPDLQPAYCYRWVRDTETGAVDGAVSWAASLWDRSTGSNTPGIYMRPMAFDAAGNVRVTAVRPQGAFISGGSNHDWSPDGRQVVFSSRGMRELSVYDRQTDDTVSLVAGSEPAWSPDGSRIAFKKWRDSIFTMRPDGSDLVRLAGKTNYPGVDSVITFDFPVWSPTGGHVLYTWWQVGGPESDIWLVPASGGAPVNLTPDIDAAYPVAWREGNQ